MNTTKAPWIVTANTIKDSPDRRVHICVSPVNNPKKIVAFTGYEGAPDEAESIANAALISIAPEMLEALISIQESAQAGTLNPEAIDLMISDVLAKLANEAGVQ